MFGDIIKGIFTFIFAFILGVSYAGDKPASDSELQQKVQDHMDIIIDESAGIADDVIDEIRKDEKVQELEQFAKDVDEIADNTKADIEAHFGKKEEADAETAEAAAPEEDTKEAEPQETGDAEEPAAEEAVEEAAEEAAAEQPNDAA